MQHHDSNDEAYDDDDEPNDDNGNYGLVTESQSIPAYANVQTYPCANCGRQFNAESLRKHQTICKKTSQKQPRKVFDAGKQRATDSDVPYKATRETTQFYKDGRQPKSDDRQATKTHWREDHEKLVRTIRHARQVTQAIESGAPVPKSVPSQVPSDYIECEFCHRHFNKYSAERHIPFCETQFKRRQSNATLSNNVRTPPRSNPRPAHSEHQINSAPSKLVTRKPQRTIEERDHPKSNLTPPATRRPTFPSPMRNPANGSPAGPSHHRPIKTRHATGNYLRGMRPVAHMHYDARVETKAGTSSYYQQHMADMKNRARTTGQRPMQTSGESSLREAPAPAKHCYKCGEAFPVERAKFCCTCGEKRFGVE